MMAASPLGSQHVAARRTPVRHGLRPALGQPVRSLSNVGIPRQTFHERQRDVLLWPRIGFNGLNIQVKLRPDKRLQLRQMPVLHRLRPHQAHPTPIHGRYRSTTARGPWVSTSQPSSVITLVSLNATPNCPSRRTAIGW